MKRNMILIFLAFLAGCSGSMSREEVTAAKLHCATRGMRAVFFIDGEWTQRRIGTPNGVRCMDDDGLMFDVQGDAR